jgi:putative peptide-modifying radical SAM enzyme
MPANISYDIASLRSLIEKDEHPIVAFYGGEPLLRYDLIKEFLQILPAEHFVINTNGYFIESIIDVIHGFNSILLSIDGRKQITDYYRDKGCYETVLHAVQLISNSSFSGELIARMAVSNKTDIYQDVSHLLKHFPFVHWQLDVIWSPLWDLHEFNQWVASSYMPGLKKLVSWWISEIKQERIHGIIPFLGIMSRILHGGRGLPCQAGEGAISITTDGTIIACPIAPDYHWNTLGSLEEGFERIHIDQPCPSCDIFEICGGRCLFANKERLWGQQGFHSICEVTKYLFSLLNDNASYCEPMKDQFRYPLYNNTTEIIP